jgi:hypothetical protein
MSFAFDSSIDFLSVSNTTAFAAPVMFPNKSKHISREFPSKAK